MKPLFRFVIEIGHSYTRFNEILKGGEGVARGRGNYFASLWISDFLTRALFRCIIFSKCSPYRLLYGFLKIILTNRENQMNLLSISILALLCVIAGIFLKRSYRNFLTTMKENMGVRLDAYQRLMNIRKIVLQLQILTAVTAFLFGVVLCLCVVGL